MKDLLINSIMNNISRYHDYDESKLKIIRFGLASLYLQITKMVVIFILAYVLGLFGTLLKLMIFYSILRLTAFGVHAKKSIHCWIASLISFTFIPYLCNILLLNLQVKMIISIICISIISIYAPADTEKRPLIHKKKRIMYKIISIIIACIYTTSLFFIKDNILSNTIIFGMALECFVILPITYKMFGVKYNNYKNYKKNEKGV